MENVLPKKKYIWAISCICLQPWMVLPANVDDRAGVWDLIDSYRRITLIGDKGYIGTEFAVELKEEKEIEILPVKRSNSKLQFPKAIRQLIFKLRRRIETSASQLTQQLNIEKVLAKSYWGFFKKILIFRGSKS